MGHLRLSFRQLHPAARDSLAAFAWRLGFSLCFYPTSTVLVPIFVWNPAGILAILPPPILFPAFHCGTRYPEVKRAIDRR